MILVVLPRPLVRPRLVDVLLRASPRLRPPSGLAASGTSGLIDAGQVNGFLCAPSEYLLCRRGRHLPADILKDAPELAVRDLAGVVLAALGAN